MAALPDLIADLVHERFGPVRSTQKSTGSPQRRSTGGPRPPPIPQREADNPQQVQGDDPQGTDDMVELKRRRRRELCEALIGHHNHERRCERQQL